MKEIEILVQVFDTEKNVLDKLSKFDFIDNKETIDIYYFDPLRDDLKPAENNRLTSCFRMRSKNGKHQITYKNDHFDGDIWTYSDEFESNVENGNALCKIIELLGLQKLLTIKNIKRTYKYKNYTIEFERVDNLGLFLEVEYVTESNDADVKKIKSEIQEFIDSLDLKVSQELNAGKPELMLKKLQNL
jgi:predicted adenylyl cyclase CyaB